MGILIFNLLFALWFGISIVAAVVAGGVASLLTKSDRAPMAIAMLTFLVVINGCDVWYRWKHHTERGRLRFFNPATGGMLFFIPVWVLFGLVPLVWTVVWIVGEKLKLL